MRVTICGHAGLYIETSQQRILIDPCFADSLLGGIVTYNPARRFNLAQMPPPTLLVVTHGHFDHWHPESLQQLPRQIPVLTAAEPHLLEQLAAIGFTTVTACNPWDCSEWDGTRLLITPSDHDEPEFGLVIQDQTGSFWHMADGEVTPAISQRVLEQMGAIDLISLKYQPVVRASMGYQRNRGAAFDKAEVIAWLETASACNPALAFPYASGLCFQGRHAWFNRYAFPLSPEDVVRLLQRRLGAPERAATVQPGDVITLASDHPPTLVAQSAEFVQTEPSLPPVWEPVDLTTLAGLSHPQQASDLQQRLEHLLTGPLTSWLAEQTQTGQESWGMLRDYEVVWQLVVHIGSNQRLNYWIDFRCPQLTASQLTASQLTATAGVNPEANFFTHISGQGLYEVLTGERPPLLFWLTGEARSYEKVIGVTAGKFWTLPNLPPEDDLCDPLTLYLRRHPPGISNPPPQIETASFPTHPQDLDILSRRGENERVFGKKALLAYLAVQEAERLELPITSTEVQALADQFQQQFALKDNGSNGLTPEAYGETLRDFVAILKLEQHYQSVLAPIQERHQRVNSIRQSETTLPEPKVSETAASETAKSSEGADL